jgi:acylphosphatase
MERITIEVADDGRVSVMAESPDEEMETMEFDNVEDAMQAVKGLIMDQEMDEEMETDEETMWNEEAAKRPMNPNMMR